MAASVALTSLLALLATNTTSQLDCVCLRLHNETDNDHRWWDDTTNAGEIWVWHDYCTHPGIYLVERCETLEQWSTVLPAFARLLPWDWDYGAPPAAVGLSCGPQPAGGGECECGAALAAVRALTREESSELNCHLADALTDYYSAHGLNDTEWTAKTLAADHLRHPKLSQLLHAARDITRARGVLKTCAQRSMMTSGNSQGGLASSLEHYSNYWRRAGRLLPLLPTRISQLFIPLAFQHVGNHTKGQQLRGWIKNMERVRDMLDTKLRGLANDAQFLSEQVVKYKLEEDKDSPGKYIKRPLLNEGLLKYQQRFLSFREDFGALCEQQLPHASQVFALADALYSFYRLDLTIDWGIENANFTDEEWQLEDQSNTMVWVDTGCLQLLAAGVDRPRCPLEELPLEASRQRRQCRERLWRDLVERPPRPPVTSYLAYNERADVSLCLLAWMAANSHGLCQDMSFSITQAVHDATCYFESPHNQTCLLSTTADAICSVSRVILLLKCQDFSTNKIPGLCYQHFIGTGNYSETKKVTWVKNIHKLYGQPTQTTLSYKESLNSMTLKYKDFKLDNLKPLEYSFIVVNILFRLSTASVYMWLPHLGNLPGKILLSFQLTGLAQVLSSEVLYRVVGFPDLSTAVLVDSSLTLLGCLWLNTFSFQLYACVRDLRLPSHLTPAEASMVFRRQIRWALIPWAIVSTACAALEKSSKYYLMHSRITLIVAISSSVTFNLVLLGLVAFLYLSNKNSMSRLNVISADKSFSKQQLIFMSVNTVILSGICVIVRIGLHQAKGIAQYVYYVHIATMLQGPVLFVFFVCNGKTLPALRNRVLALWRSDVHSQRVEMCSAAVRNLATRRGEPPPTAETSL